MRPLHSFLIAALLLAAAACSDPEPAEAPPSEPVDVAPAVAAPAEATNSAAAEESTAEVLGEAAPEAPAAAASGVHSGRVVYEEQGAVGRSKPLAGASVSQHGVAAGPTTTTNVEGNFSFSLVDTDNLAVLVAAEGYVGSLTTFSKERAAGLGEPIMLFARADEESLAPEDYGLKYNAELGGLVLVFHALSGEQAKLAGLSASISTKNGGGFLFPANPKKKGSPTKGSKLGEDNDPMVFYPGVAPGKTEIVVTPPSGMKCAGPPSAAVLADTYTTVLFECS